MKDVTWIKNTQNNDWFDFLRLNLGATYFVNKKGVYVIWYSSPNMAKVIRVGSGVIVDRLREHRANPEITKFSSYGQLKVSWVIADGISLKEDEMFGAEKYLARIYTPLVGERYPEDPKEIEISLIRK